MINSQFIRFYLYKIIFPLLSILVLKIHKIRIWLKIRLPEYLLLFFFSKYKRIRIQSFNVWIYLVASPIPPILSVSPIKVIYFPVYENLSAVILLLIPVTERSITIQLRSGHWNSITRCILHHGGIGNTTRLFELRSIPWGWIISARGTMFIIVAHLCQLIYAPSYMARLSFRVTPGSHLLFELVPSLISWISIRRVVRLVACFPRNLSPW